MTRRFWPAPVGLLGLALALTPAVAAARPPEPDPRRDQVVRWPASRGRSMFWTFQKDSAGRIWT
jgi:hypothetical protein